jgi:hypothetical protein
MPELLVLQVMPLCNEEAFSGVFMKHRSACSKLMMAVHSICQAHEK